VLTGILLTLAAAACFECSYVLQALEVRAVPAMTRASVGALGRLASRPVWLASIALSLAGFALQVLALRHAPLSLVQPLLATGLLGLLAFSATVLGEPVGRREVGAVVAIVAGVTLIAIADPQRGGDATAGLAFVFVAIALGLAALSAFVRRRPGAGALLAAAIAADALASLAAAQAARAPGLAPLAGWCALAGGGGVAAVAAESAVLQRRGAARVAPVVLGGQVAVPVTLAPLVLASSAGVSRLRVAQGEHEVGGLREVGDRLG
jgi:drug/metabolite transporter (DMT)-like permease